MSAVLVMIDGVSFTTGRLALLDGFAALFSTWAFFVLLSVLQEPSRLRLCSSGTLAGLAVACKWTALPIVLVYFGVCIWFVLVSREAGLHWRPLHQRSGILVLAAVLPVLVYCVTWSGWIFGGASTGSCGARCPSGVLSRVDTLPSLQITLLRDQVDLPRKS